MTDNLPELVERKPPQSQLSAADGRTTVAELAACLTLVAPSGMTASDRTEWIKVARLTLDGIPADLLAIGCKKARETCRFASEIVPTIMGAVGWIWEGRKNRAAIERARWENRHAPKLESNAEYATAEQVQKLIKSLGKAA